MKPMTFSEENYLKTIYHLMSLHPEGVSTNSIADRMETKASSVTDMLKKLSDKKLVAYKRYQGVLLTDSGLHEAKMIVRKHRLWEVFLVQHLDFKWDEVHDVAEQLEHIQSAKLIDRLADFLGNPTQDPHGDPIPDATGKVTKTEKQLLSELKVGEKAICVGVKDSSSEFLKYLDKQQISLGTNIEVLEKEEFDQSLHIRMDQSDIAVSQKIAGNLFVSKIPTAK